MANKLRISIPQDRCRHRTDTYLHGIVHSMRCRRCKARWVLTQPKGVEE